jgi:hypothetical protein
MLFLTVQKKIFFKSKMNRKYDEVRAQVIQILRNFFFVMKDETYVTTDSTQVPDYQYYLIDNKEETSTVDKIIKTGKFESKFLIWQAIAEDRSVSDSFVTEKR